MSKHTPGPWVIHDEEYCIDEIWGNLDGPIDGSIRATQICTLEHNDNIFANARLIAAAPEMFEILKALSNWCFFQDLGPPRVRAITRIIESIEQRPATAAE